MFFPKYTLVATTQVSLLYHRLLDVSQIATAPAAMLVLVRR